MIVNEAAQRRLRKNLDAASDEMLVALANRGLVRRAAKDRSQLEPRLEMTEDAILVHGDTWTVTMPEAGPAHATDDSPATGVTRHILAATMFLRDEWQPECDEAADSPAVATIHDASNSNAGPSCNVENFSHAHPEAWQTMVDASLEQLAKWRGKTPVIEALVQEQRAPVNDKTTIVEQPQLLVTFDDGVQVVLMTDEPATSRKKLLDQFRSTASPSEHARWVLRAIFRIQMKAGRNLPAQFNPVDISAAVAHDRHRVAKKAQRLMEAVATVGVAHPSTRWRERFRTASVTAEAAKFPRLARLLSALAEDIGLHIARHARADLSRLLQRVVLTHALAVASLREGVADSQRLYGTFRTSYTDVGTVHLTGLGACPWRTASGFEGVTAYFWEAATQRFLTASNVRGEEADRTFTVQAAYQLPLGWRDGTTMQEMCRKQVHLDGARINANGRLSTSENCRAMIHDTADWRAIDFGDAKLSRWSSVPTLLQASEPIGLRTMDPRASLAVIQPTEWSDRWFDELQQMFVWDLLDEHGEVLQLRIPWTSVDQPAIEFMESMKVGREKPVAILGRIWNSPAGASVMPISILSDGTLQGDTILCPHFDARRILTTKQQRRQIQGKRFRKSSVDTRIGESEDEDDLAAAASWGKLPPNLLAQLEQLDSILTASLESGTRQPSKTVNEALTSAQSTLETMGLHPIAKKLQKVLQADTDSLASRTLEAAYCLRLCRQASRIR